jgi:hypothetical protein
MESLDTAVEGVVSSNAQLSAGVRKEDVRKEDSRKEEKRPRAARGEAAWQKRLLPLMVSMLVTLTAFFFVASFIQLYYLQTRIEQAPQLDLKPALSTLDAFEKEIKSGTAADVAANDSRLSYVRWKTLSLLEANALERRYHQAGVLLISRIWTRYLGFCTGTILALVGAAFILGKLREGSSNVGLEGGLWKASITSASPGLVLAVLGTALMIATLATNFEMNVNDGAVYLYRPASSNQQAPQQLINDDSTRKPPAQQQTGDDGNRKPLTDTDILDKMKREGAPQK